MLSRDPPPAVAGPDLARRIIPACREASLVRQQRTAPERSQSRAVRDLVREIILELMVPHTAGPQRAMLLPEGRTVTTRVFFIPISRKKRLIPRRTAEKEKVKAQKSAMQTTPIRPAAHNDQD